MNNKFEDYLQEVHINNFPEILDDDLPDAFQDWLSILEIDELIRIADLYGKKQFLAGKEELIKELKHD